MKTFPTAAAIQPLEPTASPATGHIEGIDQVVAAWHAAATELAAAKDREKSLRDVVASSQIFSQKLGVESHDLGFGYMLKRSQSERVHVENKNGEAATVYSQFLAMGAESQQRVARLFKFSATISERVYKELPANEKKLVDPLLTRKLSPPTLKVHVPN
jgi:hypothetical protein